jgi:FkbM family methyltransferase
MNSRDSQDTTDNARHRFDLRRMVSLRRINILLILIGFTFITINAGQLSRRIGFWWTGSVRIDGLTFYLSPRNSYLTGVVLSTGTYEPEETRLFRSKCRRGDTVIDVGANVGWYTIIASKLVGKNGRVIAFEPDPESFALLKRNVLANGCDNAILEQKALSNTAGTLTLHLDEENKVMHSTVFDTKGAAIKVEALRLDDYLENRFKNVDFVKIDVEGAEPMVLEGMQRTIQSHPGIRLVIEFAPERVIATGRQPKQYLEGFINQGFRISIIDEAERQMLPTTPTRLLAAFEANPPGTYTNLFLQRGAD